MHCLQAVFTTLQTIWTQRNLVVHEGKHPNPLEVILIAQFLTCQYLEAFSSCSLSSHIVADQHRPQQRFGGPWQLIIKVVGARKKKARRCGFAYEAKNMQGNIIFQGVSSCGAETIPNAIQEAMVEAAIKARSLGFNQIQFLSNSRRSVQFTNKEIAPSWKERTLNGRFDSFT